MSIESLNDYKDELIDSAENELLDQFDGIENSIYSAVSKEIDKMNQKDGKILFDEENMIIYAGLASLIIGAIQGSKYPTKVNRYLANYDGVAEYAYKIQNEANGLDVDEMRDVISPIKDQIISQVLDGLTGQGINSQFIKPLTEAIYKNIIAGASINDLKKSLESLIKSNEERLGVFKRYVSQISRDSIMQYEGQINSRIADEFGLDAFLYLGSLIKDSRPQCIRWVGMGVLQKKDLPKELAFAYSSGSGQIPGTTPDNFVIYRGGYNCRHTAVPIKLTKEKKKQFGL